MRSTERSRGSWRGNIHVGTCSHVLNARQNCIFQDSTRMITATSAIYINVKHRKPPAFLSLNFYFKLHGPMKLNYDFIALRRTLPEPFLGRLPPDPFLAIRPRTEKYEKRKIYIYITRIFFFFFIWICVYRICVQRARLYFSRSNPHSYCTLFSRALSMHSAISPFSRRNYIQRKPSDFLSPSFSPRLAASSRFASLFYNVRSRSVPSGAGRGEARRGGHPSGTSRSEERSLTWLEQSNVTLIAIEVKIT